MVRLGGAKFCILAVAPSGGNGQNAVRASRADVVGSVSDHQGLARVRSGQVQRGPNKVSLVAGALGPLGAVNRVEVAIDVEMAHDEPRGLNRSHSDDLQRVAGGAERRQRLGDSREYTAFEDADLVEQWPIDVACAIDQHVVVRIEQCAEDRREPRANELAQLRFWPWLPPERCQRLIDRAADSRKRVGKRSVEIEEQMHLAERRKRINSQLPTSNSQ